MKFNFFNTIIIIIFLISSVIFLYAYKKKLVKPDTRNSENISKLRDINNDLNAIFVMSENVDLEETDWVPIGSNGDTCSYFQGVFDGRGYDIEGISISTNSKNPGLFCGIGSNAVIKNINIKLDSPDRVIRYNKNMLTSALAEVISTGAAIENVNFIPHPKARSATNDHAHVGHIGGNIPPPIWIEVE